MLLLSLLLPYYHKIKEYLSTFAKGIIKVEFISVNKPLLIITKEQN